MRGDLLQGRADRTGSVRLTLMAAFILVSNQAVLIESATCVNPQWPLPTLAQIPPVDIARPSQYQLE